MDEKAKQRYKIWNKPNNWLPLIHSYLHTGHLPLNMPYIKWVKQGCILSLPLYNFYINLIVECLTKNETSPKIAHWVHNFTGTDVDDAITLS